MLTPKLRNPLLVCILRDAVALASRNCISLPDLSEIQSKAIGSLNQAMHEQKAVCDAICSAQLPTLLLSYEKAISRPVEFLEAISRFVGQKVTKENIGRLTSLVKPNHRGYALRARSLEYEESFDLRGVIESVKNGCMIGRVASAHSNEPIVVEAWVDGLRVKEREFDLAGHGLEDWTSISFEIGNKLVKRSHSLQLTFGQDGRDFDNSPFTWHK